MFLFETFSKTKAEKASKLQQRASKRLEETLKTQEPLEDILRRSKARAAPAETKISQQAGAAEREVAKQRALSTEYTMLENEIKRTPSASDAMKR